MPDKVELHLYRVLCRGMTGTPIGGRTSHGDAYVVAPDAETAYRMLRASLDVKEVGFAHERELSSVTLLATASDYPNCGTVLYLPHRGSPPDA